MCTSTRVLTYKPTKYIQQAIPQYPPIWLSILDFVAIGITFNNVTFKFGIDHDDGTVRTDYDMR